MAAVFVVGCGIAMIWSAVKYQIVYRALVDSLPPQLPSGFAFPVYALSPSTPLPLQAEYVKSLWGGCVAFLCLSLCFFSLQQLIVGCVSLAVFFASVVSAIKSWKTYKENCNRAVAQDDRKEP
jgi:hypothetical protein